MRTAKIVGGIIAALVALIVMCAVIFGYIIPSAALASLERSVSLPATEQVAATKVTLDGEGDTLTDACMLVDKGDMSDKWPFGESYAFGHRTGWNFPEGTHEVDVISYNARQREALNDWPLARIWVMPASTYELLMLDDNEADDVEGEEPVRYYGDEEIDVFGLSGYSRGDLVDGDPGNPLHHCVLKLPGNAGCVVADIRDSAMDELTETVSIDVSF